MANHSAEITVCMGSSCFARGNNRNLEVLIDYLRKNNLEGKVEIKGHLCTGHCSQGPNLLVGGRSSHNVQPTAIATILEEYLRGGE